MGGGSGLFLWQWGSWVRVSCHSLQRKSAFFASAVGNVPVSGMAFPPHRNGEHDQAGQRKSKLESVIGLPKEIVRAKVLTQLDEVMKEFIGKSPLVFISSIDANGHVDISPKGDPCGFVKIDASGNLLIPERPGNKLTFGFRNILRNGEIGLIFIVPNQRETLRVKGIATLHNEPSVLAKLQVNNKPALLCTYVDVKECFMHCGKALIIAFISRDATSKHRNCANQIFARRGRLNLTLCNHSITLYSCSR